jgi:ureidoglycolate hydrolase
MTHAVAVKPLTRAGFAPFGEVLDTEGAQVRLINAGTCKRFHALATVETRGGDARAVVSLFRAEPTALPLHLSMMERHPLGSQASWPLSGGDWLVAVAPDENGLPGAPLVFGAYPAPQFGHHARLCPTSEARHLRTTRSVSPTEAGERLLRTVGPRFEEIEAELEAGRTS